MSTLSTLTPAPRRPGIERAATQLLLAVLPCALTLWLAITSLSHHWVAQDFSMAYYPAAHRLLDGGTPYAVTHNQIVSGAAFVYPALSAVLLAPLALFSSGTADHLYTLLCIVLVPATLWVLGVRDWRVFGVTLLWYPTIIGWQGENISVPLMFLTALAWRHRHRPLAAGVITAAAISMKPFLWPLAIWLLATRRWRAAVWALTAGLGFNVLAWALVGFNEIHTYLQLSGQVTDALWRGGYGALAIAQHLGLGRGAGEALLLAVALVLGSAIVVCGRGQRREREAFTLTVALMLLASPLTWIHYFVFLAVPLAIWHPRLSAAWVIPVGMWLLPPGTQVAAWQVALAWVLAGSSLKAAVSARRPPQVVPR
jgi:uncharacterized membrane protein